MKLQVIVTEFGAAANIGGTPETYVKAFELPQEIADYIAANRGQWSTISFGLAQEDRQP